VTDLVSSAFNDKQIARKYVPYFVTIFFFILLNNWFGLLPFVGEGVRSGENPLLRPFTGDLNATLALGVVTMVMVYTWSIKEAGGFGKFLKHFFIGSPFNPAYLLLGIIEMITDLTRVISLSLRLFLNIAIGEIVIVIFTYLGHALIHLVLPDSLSYLGAVVFALPFTLLELGVAALQAYIFTVLASMYLAIAVNAANEHDDESTHLTDTDVPERISARAPGVT
jgi:F-type H+-transporting ATPase subunit a